VLKTIIILKKHIKLDMIIKNKYNQNKNYYIKFAYIQNHNRTNTVRAHSTRARVRSRLDGIAKHHRVNSESKLIEQSAGMFPVIFYPYECNLEEININFAYPIPTYSEPTIQYVKQFLVLDNYDTFIASHKARRTPFNLEMINSHNFPQWKSVLLNEHLRNHKYAHNGVNDLTDILRLIGQPEPTYTLLVFIHSLCHIYDALYMFKKESELYNSELKALESYYPAIPDDQQRYCLFKLLNAHAGEFLEKLPDRPDQYILPYTINIHAINDKARQYHRVCTDPIDRGCMIESFLEKIITGRSPIITGSTTELPNSGEP